MAAWPDNASPAPVSARQTARRNGVYERSNFFIAFPLDADFDSRIHPADSCHRHFGWLNMIVFAMFLP
jgi:hypothetical protein